MSATVDLHVAELSIEILPGQPRPPVRFRFADAAGEPLAPPAGEWVLVGGWHGSTTIPLELADGQLVAEFTPAITAAVQSSALALRLDGLDRARGRWVTAAAQPEPGDPVTIRVDVDGEVLVVQGSGAAGPTGPPGTPGDDGREVELSTSATHVRWRLVGDPSWTDLVALADLAGPAGEDGAAGGPGAPGADGREVALRATDTHVQWQWSGAVDWSDLVALEDLTGPQGDPGEPGLDGDPGEPGADGADGEDGAPGADGREVELRAGETHIEWRYDGDGEWADLVALVDLVGPAGEDGEDGAQGDQGPEGPMALSTRLDVAGGPTLVLTLDAWHVVTTDEAMVVSAPPAPDDGRVHWVAVELVDVDAHAVTLPAWSWDGGAPPAMAGRTVLAVRLTHGETPIAFCSGSEIS